jgi:hypothetical protein
MATKLS